MLGETVYNHIHIGETVYKYNYFKIPFFLRSITHGSTLLYPSFTNVGLQKGKEGEKQAREG